MATSAATRTGSRSAPRATPKPQAKKGNLRVVRTDDRVRTVGAISSVVAVFFFVLLLSLAALHAVVVQTQADLDEVNADITALEELRVVRQADLAWADSAVGLEVTALAAGLVPAAETVILAPIAPGLLTPPLSVDPFAADGTSPSLGGNAELVGKTE